MLLANTFEDDTPDEFVIERTGTFLVFVSLSDNGTVNYRAPEYQKVC